MLAGCWIEVAQGCGQSECGTDLVGAARGDAPVVEAVSADSSATFREIQDQACGGSTDLIEELRIASSNDGERLAEGPDQFQADSKCRSSQ